MCGVNICVLIVAIATFLTAVATLGVTARLYYCLYWDGADCGTSNLSGR